MACSGSVRGLILAATLAAGGCSPADDEAPPSGSAGAELEAAAVAAGLVADPATLFRSGSFEQRSELGHDRLCLLADDESAAVGLVANFGPDSRCVARGTARLRDGKLELTLGRSGDCRIDAVVDGDAMRLPGALPDGCAAFCSGRASLAGVSFPAAEQGARAARALRDDRGRSLCE